MRKRFEKETHDGWYVFIAASMLAIFVVDLQTRIGVATWLFYLIPLGACIFPTRPVAPITVAAISTIELLEKMATDEAYSFPPVIVYTGRTLSADEEQQLRRYSKSIIIKGTRSPERLLDEVTLFLHRVEASLPAEQQRMLRVARSREAVFEKRRILLVEDDVRNVFAITRVLEPHGAILDIARNGREALEVLGKNPEIDLVRWTS